MLVQKNDHGLAPFFKRENLSAISATGKETS